MPFVICPNCNSVVEIPVEAIGPQRSILWNVAHCTSCDTGFDYDDMDVVDAPPPDAN